MKSRVLSACGSRVGLLVSCEAAGVPVALRAGGDMPPAHEAPVLAPGWPQWPDGVTSAGGKVLLYPGVKWNFAPDSGLLWTAPDLSGLAW